MKITVKGGGGFAGASEHYEVDTARAPQGAGLEALLHDIDFFHAPPPARPVGADIPCWDITVEDGQTCRTVSIADDGSAACSRWKPLRATPLGSGRSWRTSPRTRRSRTRRGCAGSAA
jgi:hypothetical protein